MFVIGWAEGLKRKNGKKICLVHICIYNYISFDLLLSFILPFILLYSDFPFLRFALFAPSIFRAIKLWWITRKVLITTKIEKFIYADYAPEWRKIFSKENCNCGMQTLIYILWMFSYHAKPKLSTWKHWLYTFLLGFMGIKVNIGGG